MKLSNDNEKCLKTKFSKNSNKIIGGMIGIIFFVLIAYLLIPDGIKNDDWQYKEGEGIIEKASQMIGSVGMMKSASLESAAAPGNIGFSTGGAKDINNFRENIKNEWKKSNVNQLFLMILQKIK